MYGRPEYTHDRTPPKWAVSWLRRLFKDRRFAWNNRAKRWDLVKFVLRRDRPAGQWVRCGTVTDPVTGEPCDITTESMEHLELQAFLRDDRARRSYFTRQVDQEVAEDAQIAQETESELTEVFRRYHPTHLKNRGHAKPRELVSMAGARR